MKLITAFLHHVRVSDVVDALNDAGYRNIVLYDVKGTLKPLDACEVTYSVEARLVISETKLSLVCEDSDIDQLTTIIRKTGRVGTGISGWVYVSPIEQALPVG